MLGMGNNEGKVEDTLKQRGSIYGSYSRVCGTRSTIMDILKIHHKSVNVGDEMDSKIEMMFSDLVLKLVRGAGAPTYSDSFHDLAGYATLIEEYINESYSKTS